MNKNTKMILLISCAKLLYEQKSIRGYKVQIYLRRIIRQKLRTLTKLLLLLILIT